MNIHRGTITYTFLQPTYVDDLKKKDVVKLNQYILQAKIGIGFIAKVYLAVDTQTSKKYAAKAIKISSHSLSNSTSGFEREIRIMRRLNHPNIVKLHETLFRKDTKTIYLIMEYAQCGSLQDSINEQKKMSEEEIASIFYQVLKGMEYLHSKCIVHQDIKPSNILLFDDGVAKLSDFGIGHSFQSADMVFGTPAYQAPEYFDDADQEIDPVKEDIWSLGITLYQTAFGTLPYTGSTAYEIANVTKETELQIPSYASESLTDILHRMLSIDPSKRASVEELLEHPFFDKLAQKVSFPKIPLKRLKSKSLDSIQTVRAEVYDERSSFILDDIPVPRLPQNKSSQLLPVNC
ncbi:CAMK family protein kinase [Histomonas meleagridis]|uniref:CAMK family protein kinase n=1 Tax=Histomonas meleagridis TaxID=135588 RepID=UPI00355A4808|nr:CAMK family protein kinase [Histomonas meleagridis]KAH0803222.1 CAMK family protein kinase [Histomonas meleagridis]